MEIEIKYQNGKSSAASVLKNARICPFIGKEQHMKMLAIYYDTQNSDFSSSALSLRLRQEGNSFVCALKGGKIENGLARRVEIEVAALSIRDGWKKICSTPAFLEIKSILPQNSPLLCSSPRFIETARMEFLRTYWDYVCLGVHCEFAQDTGYIYVGTHKEAIDEFEIELKYGSEADFLSLIAQLEREMTLIRGNKSKYERALSLADAYNA